MTTKNLTPERKHQTTDYQFPHQRLDAYRVGVQFAKAATELAGRVPRGHRSVADHLQRAGTNAVLLLAEGANRRGKGEKRQRFVESRGECAEAAAAADLIGSLGLGSEEDAKHVVQLAGRVGAMLTKLIARVS